MERYDPAAIEKKWQERWQKAEAFNTPDIKPGAKNFYLLTEFAYPSGNLHVGHWYAFAVPDILARYLRMRGHNVLYPAGFDAFGLPAENAAIKNNLNPRVWTYQNIEHMRTQQRSMGATFDWSREVITCDPGYYKWTQWMFVQFFKKGLAYRKETAVNWCPNDKTVLANEQVIDGKCERCGHEVEQRLMPQWNLKITDYADQLIDDLDALQWPAQIKEAQKNWIGRSEGAQLHFALTTGGTLAVFTTRPDTLFGATYMVVAPEHSLVDQFGDASVQAYVKKAKKKSELERLSDGKEKSGIELKGVKAIHPATKKELPIYVADYVLMGYGTGAIMAVPAHDERDFAFAKKFNLPVREVITGGNSVNGVYVGEGNLINSGQFDGMASTEAKRKITEFVGGRMTKHYHLRDWVVSRQRYWGVPIPMIHCEKCGYNPVPEKDLPVLLPDVEDYLPTGDGKSPLAKVKSFVETTCPTCGGKAERETDTLDTFVDSSWYFLRYCDPKNEQEFASKEKLKIWMPVNLYSGGSEHTTMHVLYSRFWHKALYDLGLVGEREPYLCRMNRGLIMGPDGQKMSKRWNNVIDPDEQVRQYGADTVRTYLAFIGPYNEAGAYPWNPGGISGVRRFLERVWKLAPEAGPVAETKTEVRGPAAGALEMLLKQTIQKVGDDIASLKMNTAVSALMILTNSLSQLEAVPRDTYKILLQLLSPFAPHIAHELAERAGFTKEEWEYWPAVDTNKFTSAVVSVAVQVNGKTRATIELATTVSKEEAVIAARSAAGKWLQGKAEKKIIYVPGKIVSFVV
jgi:leucyl-tRNA synthetase